MAITSAMVGQVTELYTSLFGRAPESDGLGYWVSRLGNGDSVTKIANEMYAVTAARVIYPSYLTNEQIIGKFYSNVLGRTADATGLAFWTAKLNATGATVGDVVVQMIAAVNTYSGTDVDGLASKALFTNKVAAGTYYATTGGNSTTNTVLSLVSATSTAATVNAAIDAVVTPPAVGKVMTLTTGLDTGASFTGSTGDDTFVGISSSDATLATLTAGDSLVGGTGTDTLLLASSGTTTAAALVSTTGVETLSISNNSTGATFTVDSTLMTGLNKVVLNAGVNPVLVTNSANILNADLNSVNVNVTLSGAAASFAGTADSAKITLNGVATTANVTVTDAGVETLNVVTSGSASGSTTGGFGVTIADSALKTMNVSGNQAAILTTTFVSSLATDVGTFDASANTVGVNATLTAGTSGKLSVTGGAGDDTISVGAITKNMTISGGAGSDTLSVSGATYDTTSGAVQPGAYVTNFEVIKAAGTVDMRALPGSSFTSATVAADAIITKAGAALTAVTATAASALTYDVATDTAADKLTMTLSSSTGAATVFSLTSTTADQLSIVSSGTSGVTNTLTIDDAAALTITVTGDKSLALGAIASAVSLNSVDASAHTGLTFTADASASLVAVTLKGSAGVPSSLANTVNTLTGGIKSDVITGGLYSDVLTGGAGNDTITGGGGNDTISGGTGNDVIITGDGNNSISGGTGDDSITAGAGNDSIDGGSGNNTLIGGAGNDKIAQSTLSDSTSVDGGTGTDQLALVTSTLTSTSSTSVNGYFIPTTDAAPTITGVESIYVAIDSSAGTLTVPTVLDMIKVTGATSSTLYVESDGTATSVMKIKDFGGSAIKLYGATTGAVEDQFLTIDGIGQSAVTVTLEDYDAVALGATTFTGITGLTIAGRSTSQFTGNADQANSLVAVIANSVDSLTITTSGSTAANTTAYTQTSASATTATAITLTSGANDYLVAGTITGGANMQTMTISTTAGTAAGGMGITRANLASAALTQVTINLADSTYMSTTGAAGGNAVDFDFTSAAKFDVTLNAGAGAEIDLTDEVITAGTFALATGATLQLTSGFGAGASSYVFTGRGDLDDANGTNTFAIAGTTATFNTSGLTVDADALIITTSTTGASTITTGLGTDNITGGAGNDVISSGAAVDTITGGNGDDNLNGGSGADIIYADNAGTKRAETVTITYAASENDVITVNGVAVTFATGANLAASKAAMIAAINGTAALANIVIASANAGAAIVDLTYLVDGVTIVSVDTASTGNDNTVAQVTAGTNGSANGNDVLTGGTGADVFVFGGSVGTGGNGAAPSATVFDTITDYTTASDIINFRTALTLVAEGTSSASQGVVSATGLVTFHADTAATLAARLAATEAAMTAATAVAGEAAVFVVGSDSYIFVSDGVAGLGANDQLIKLTGISAATGITLTLGDITGVV